MDEENLSKIIKESVDLKGTISPPLSNLHWSKDWLGQKKLALSLET